MRPATVVAVVALLAGLLAGCVPSAPSRSDWNQQAVGALEDVASEVATASIALREHRRGHLVGKARVVLLVDAEESAGTAVEDFTALQPPRGMEARNTEVGEALARAADLVTEVRIAVVGERTGAYDELAEALARERTNLVTLAERLR